MKSAASRFFAPVLPPMAPPRYGSRIPAHETFLNLRVDLTTAFLPKPDELDWWDWSVLLLQTAAEIEHGLLVQYLYAAYSLSSGGFDGVPPADAAAKVARWRRTLVKLAREEMAHLLTVQNLFHVVGSPPMLERQPFPADSPLQPFPFLLEPVSKGSLAKYIAAEMPAHAAGSIPDIIAAAEAAAGQRVNRVGPLYMTLVDIFQNPAKLTDDDRDFASAVTVQADPADWASQNDGLLGGLIESRDRAVRFLTAIGEQGEGSWTAPVTGAASHYDRLLEIYRAFPGTDGAAPAWNPASKVPTNPTTEQNGSAGSIRDPISLVWARFGNVRYRALLTAITHALSLAGPARDAAGPTYKGRLIEWVFEEMKGRNVAGLGALAEFLAARPLVGDGTSDAAGLPFELPYTATLPSSEKRRWRLHLSLVNASQLLVGQLRGLGETDAVLSEYEAIDADRRAFITPLI